ncbi:MAG: putative transcriptional regulator [Cyanobium sp.]|jgi:predicted transcriptional regulator
MHSRSLRWCHCWPRLCHWLRSPVAFCAGGAGRPDQAGGQHFQPTPCFASTAIATACWQPLLPTGSTSNCRSRRRSSHRCGRSAACQGGCAEQAAAIRERRCQPGCHQSFSWRAPVGIAIELNDQQAQALSETARRLHVSEADLASAAVRDLVARQSVDFQAAADRVLKKNQELYRRLA